MDTSGIIGLELQCILEFIKIPLRQLLIRMFIQGRQNISDLLVEVAGTILLFLDIIFDSVRDNFLKHGYQVVDRQS